MNSIKSIIYRLSILNKLKKIEKLYYNHQYLESLSLCNELIDITKGGFIGSYYRGLNNVQLHLYREAIEDFYHAKNSLLKLNIRNWNTYYLARIHHQLSIINFKQQRYNEAINEISKAISYDDNYTDGYQFRAIIKEEVNDLMGALDDLNLALKRKPGNKYLTHEKNLLVYKITKDKL